MSTTPTPETAPATAPPVDPERAHATRELRAGRPAVMEALCRRLLAANAADTFAVNTLGHILLARNNFDEAIAISLKAVELAPQELSHHLNLAHFYIQTKRYPMAVKYAEAATRLAPDNVRVWINYASSCYHCEQFQDSIEASKRALALDPKNDKALNNLATALKAQGRIPEAVQAYQQALVLDPTNAITHTNLLLTLMYDASVPVEQIVQVAKRYAEQFEAPVVGKRKPYRNVVLPDRRLRIGFISPDFTNHAVMYFAEPVLARLPRNEFEIYCYYTYPAGDFITERVKGLADGFRYVPLHDPDRTAEMIREDEIDVLVDLAGHTAKNGLQAMCLKPAPVQVTWLGYPGTTGLKAIDWRITDHLADPPGADALYTEGLIRLPGTFCAYRPHIRSPLHRVDPRYQVQPAPCLENGYITFGCCNNVAKITPPTIAAWSQILHQVPDSKLLIEAKDMGSPASTASLRSQFAAQGIEESRLIFVSRDPRQQYLTYHRIDIALDPFPLTGGTTTFDAMWMGVPVVTVLGRTFRERLSGTIIAGGGFHENITRTVEAYIERVVALASDPAALAQARQTMRPRMQASTLLDEARFVKLFGQALRGVWQQWCRTQEANGVQPGRPVPGQDVLVNMDGRRITLPSAVFLIQRWFQGNQAAKVKAVKLAQALLEVAPEQPEALALMAKVNFVRAPAP